MRVMLADLMGKGIYWARNLMSLCEFLYLVNRLGRQLLGHFEGTSLVVRLGVPAPNPQWKETSHVLPPLQHNPTKNGL